MANHIYPGSYRSLLDFNETEKAIKLIKDSFQQNLSAELRLRRVTAPIFVLKGTGINDDLSGVERKVTFQIRDMADAEAEVVNSLAKWKRLALAEHGIQPGYGLYTDMNAIRPDEELDNIHSLYVDQWDWERVITEKDRSLNFLREIVGKIYESIKRTEYVVCEHYPAIAPGLPDNIVFLHSEDLEAEYPGLNPRQRENEAAQRYGAVFIAGIGAPLANGKPHDARAPDYDDWISPSTSRHRGLNGDIVVWNEVLNSSFELSSMGIRVDSRSLLSQLELSGNMDRVQLAYHRKLLDGELPLSVGGGIGQSRLCMYYLRKAHIGEIQSSIWPPAMVDDCRRNNIHLVGAFT